MKNLQQNSGVGGADLGYEISAVCSKLRFDSYCFSATPRSQKPEVSSEQSLASGFQAEMVYFI
jgi:hypothetical protein